MQGETNLKVVRRSLDRQAADILRGQILSGRIPPGARLVETQLAEQVQVSRGTIRSALSELAHQGLVEQVAYTKWQVPDLSPRDAWELCTLRSALEGLAASLAALSQDVNKSALLTEACQTLAAAVEQGRQDEVAEADFDLHHTIVALSGHGRLMKQYDLIEQQVRRYITCSTARLTDPEEIVGEHESIVRAILDGDADRAEHLAKNHKFQESQELHDHLVEMAKDEAEGVTYLAPRER